MAPRLLTVPGAGASFGRVKGPPRKGRGAVSHITMLVEPLRVFQAVLVFDPHYGITDGDLGTPLPDNVIERVTPRFFW